MRSARFPLLLLPLTASLLLSSPASCSSPDLLSIPQEEEMGTAREGPDEEMNGDDDLLTTASKRGGGQEDE
jgi:hypothetical protein